MSLRRLVIAALLALAGGPALAQQGDPSFNLVNRSGQAINEIYVTPVTQQNWGRDLLGSDVLPNGRAFAVRIAPAAGCRQDVRVVYADRRPEERRNVDTCAITEMVFGAAAPAPQARPAPGGSTGNPSFNLVNQGGQPIREVYVSSVRQQDWGTQRLPQPLAPGAFLPVSLPQDDCVNDVRVVWADGRREDRRQVDTCRMVNLVFG
ncbi:hypothetical protein [Falsiroseomonas sp. HW251]|uniref:hypothetical protein n=1 Tax=Falsiroseomonas sp. HW251 TaxID=3390998 RepID=UPI003D31041E